MSCVFIEGHSDDGCDLASTLCKYDLGKGDSFVPIWSRVRRARQRGMVCAAFYIDSCD